MLVRYCGNVLSIGCVKLRVSILVTRGHCHLTATRHFQSYSLYFIVSQITILHSNGASECQPQRPLRVPREGSQDMRD